MRDRTPSTERPLTEVVVGSVTDKRGYPKYAIALTLVNPSSNTVRDTLHLNY